MLHFLERPLTFCTAAILLSVIASGGSLAQGKSQGVGPQGAGPPTMSGGGAASIPTLGSNSSGGSAVGIDGELQSLYSVPLKDNWSLQMGVGVDAEQQSRSSPTGDINGRVGLGFKF